MRAHLCMLLVGASALGSIASCPDDPELDLCGDGNGGNGGNDGNGGNGGLSTKNDAEETETSGAASLKVSAHRVALMLAFVLPGSRSNLFALASVVGLAPQAVATTTCGYVKGLYKDQGCCGYPETIINLDQVTDAMVDAAQKEWGGGIITIAAAKTKNENYTQAAYNHITNLYNYGNGGSVLFKPTMAAQKQFRDSFEGALSYFVATNNHAPEDSGFAIKGWTAVRFANEEIITSGVTAMAMGNYFFTNPDGKEVKVEYSFGYVLGADGKLRINLHHSSMPYVPGITTTMVTDAQKEWGDGIVTIASAKMNGGNFEQAAEDHINNLYAYANDGKVLFKPTLAAAQQFRASFAGALSYFVATNNAAPEDSGFAIKNWTAVRFVNEEIILSGPTAMAMGNYYFTTPQGKEVKVEYSFGYVLGSDGKVRINLHHSSMPFVPGATREMVIAAQKEWGDGIVTIAAAKMEICDICDDEGVSDFEQAATAHINNLYAYGNGTVLFKPTLAAAQQFRSSFDGALSYFVATNNHALEDSGFAIKNWTAVRFVNEEIITSGPTASAMGNYYFTTPEGKEVKVEYSFGYVLDAEGKLRINLHHSSMPFVPGATREMVLAAQKEWGDGIVTIASAKMNGSDFEQAATAHINNLYAYGNGTVLFKPTLAAAQQFRSSFDGALSYFVATNNAAPEDSGFAIKNWTAVRFVNEEIITSGPTASAMGNYYFTTPEGKEVKVEYSFGYVLDAEGKLRINLHHSSMPFVPGATREMVIAAQKEWGDGIVEIASAKVNGQNFTQEAVDHISELYAYGNGTVLFKPTLASNMQFRSSFEGALSYFVASNNHAPEDSGFAIKNWTAVRFENEEIITSGPTAVAMGNYFFNNTNNTETKVEYSFGYMLGADGKLRINLHHSSMPYSQC